MNRKKSAVLDNRLRIMSSEPLRSAVLNHKDVKNCHQLFTDYKIPEAMNRSKVEIKEKLFLLAKTS